MIQGIIGKKMGMTQVFGDGGKVEGVTAIAAGPCTVTQIKTAEKEGYLAAQLGFEQTKKAGKFKHLREVRVDSSEDIKVGDKVDVSLFKAGDVIDVTGISKGRGFAGVVKRHHFAGGPKTHGQSDRHRAPGAIGSTTSPGRVLKGTRMAGHMGDERVTVRHLRVFGADPARNLLLVQGAVPGARNSLLIIRKSNGGR